MVENSTIGNILRIYNLQSWTMHNLSLQIYMIFTLLVYNLQASKLKYNLQIYLPLKKCSLQAI